MTGITFPIWCGHCFLQYPELVSHEVYENFGTPNQPKLLCPNCKTEGAVTGLDLNCKECGQSFVNRNFFDENEPVGPYSKDDLKNLVEVICPKCKTVNRRDITHDSDNTHKT